MSSFLVHIFKRISRGILRPIGFPLLNERGVALVESAYAIPVLTIFLVNMVNLGALINDYRALEDAATNGLLQAIRTPLETGAYKGLTPGQTCAVITGDPTKTGTGIYAKGHESVQGRVRALISMNSGALPIKSVCISSGLETSGSMKDTAWVKVHADYEGFILFKLPIDITVRGPYLS